MSNNQPSQSPSYETVKLLIERQAALELYRASRIAIAAGKPGEDDGTRTAIKIEDVHTMIVTGSTATAFLNALAVPLGFGVTPEARPGEPDYIDYAEIIVSQPTAINFVNALIIGLGGGPEAQVEKSEQLVEIFLERYVAVDLLNSMVVNLGLVPGTKKGKGSGKGGAEYQSVERSGGNEELTDDEVDCTVYAPGQASPGNTFLVQVFTHLPEQAAVLEGLAKEAEPQATRRGGRTLDKKIQRGTRLTFNLTMPDLTIDEPSQSLVWRGKPEPVQFAVTVPENFKPRVLAATIIVSENSIPIGHLKFIFKIVAPDAAPASESRPVPAAGLIRYRQAFISYASADRAEVLKRVQMLNASKVSFFQDLLTLEPGDHWGKLLYEYIDKSDVFFLFWSQAASESQWVGKEIAFARERQAGSAEAMPEIIPILIEGPPPAKPPEELSFLHFNDKFLYFIKAEEEMADAR
jgi:hypothetical protein